MKKEYIRTEEMKELFTLVPLLKNIKLSLDADLKRLAGYKKDDDKDYIQGLTFNNFQLSDMPHSNTNAFHSSTENGALQYEQEIKNEAKEIKKAQKEIVREKCHIEIVLDKIEISLNSIPKFRRKTLEMKYWEKKTWNEIMEYLNANKIFYCDKQVREFAREDIKKVNIIALIDIQMYKNVIALINRNND